MVFGNPLQRVSDEADMPSIEVFQPAELVENLAALRVRRERVDREIAPRRVFFPIIGKSDCRASPVGRDIAAEAGDLDHLAVADRGYGAVIDACRDSLDLRCFKPLDDLFRTKPGREVEIADRKPKQIVANRSADITRCAAVGIKRPQQLGHAAAFAPLGGVEPQFH